MSSCGNNGSDSNITVTSFFSKDKCKNDVQKALSTSTTVDINETQNLTKINDRSISNVVANTITSVTAATNDNAKIKAVAGTDIIAAMDSAEVIAVNATVATTTVTTAATASTEATAITAATATTVAIATTATTATTVTVTAMATGTTATTTTAKTTEATTAVTTTLTAADTTAIATTTAPVEINVNVPTAATEELKATAASTTYSEAMESSRTNRDTAAAIVEGKLTIIAKSIAGIKATSTTTSITTTTTAREALDQIVLTTPDDTKTVSKLCDQGQPISDRLISEMSATTGTAITTATAIIPPTIISAQSPPPTTPTPTPTTHVSDHNLSHTASEPTFGIVLRQNQHEQQQKQQQQQQQKQQTFRSCHGTKHKGSPEISSSIEDIATSSSGSGIRAGSVSASASPSMARKCADVSALMPRRVSFPKSDNELVTGYLEPANPWEHASMVKSISEITELYVMSCHKHNTTPLPTILDHLKAVELNKTARQPLLSLKSIKMAPSDCEALEEIFKRVQYKTIDLSSCDLTESAAMALFEMIEYYEAANELDISSNSDGMTHRGWTSCTYMVSHSRALQVLNAQGNPISRTGAENLGHALSTSNIHTIKLEHCGLKGAPLSSLCYKLRHNRVLRELWLAHNDLDCDDAESIGTLLAVNHYLQLVDISNNNIRDEGLKKIVKALITQARELEKRTFLQRASAIDDVDDYDLMDISSGATNRRTRGAFDVNDNANDADGDVGLVESDTSQSEDMDDEAFVSHEKTKLSAVNDNATLTTMAAMAVVVAQSDEDEITTTVCGMTSSFAAAEDATEGDEDDTEETVKSSATATLKGSGSSTQNGGVGGQSMLDKLLSMNSTESSSSDDVASNISTDTLAACGSEDASMISDDIFNEANTATTVLTNTSTNTNAFTQAMPILATTSVTMAAVNSDEVLMKSSNERPPSKEEVKTEEDGGGLHEESSGNVDSNSSNGNGNGNGNANVSITISTSIISNDSNSNNTNQHQTHPGVGPLKASPCVYEVTAGETDCLISACASKALDVNKTQTKLLDDFDDTHSTDSAFESASEGDISRHLPEEFSRLSASFESSRIDEILGSKVDLADVETATIATESTECLVTAAAAVASLAGDATVTKKELLTELPAQVHSSATSPTTPPIAVVSSESGIVPPVLISLDVASDFAASDVEYSPLPTPSAPPLPKVTISEHLLPNRGKITDVTSPRPSPTPPPPSTSPGGASLGLRRTESSCVFITSAMHNRSQSSDSLCSDTSLDGSLSSDINFPATTQFSEKLAKNDTLTRQQRNCVETPAETNGKGPCGLKALALWNNSLTKESGHYIAELLAETTSLELLNIGKNCLSNDFVATLKDSLMRNTTLTTLGLQSAHLSAKGIETLSSILTFGGNCTLQRIDIRDNKLEVESLSTLAEALKSNTTVCQLDIDDEPKRLSTGNDAHLDYARVLENVRSMCSRNEKTQTQLQAADKSVGLGIAAGRHRTGGGYYLGSRKISLTCQARPTIVDHPSADKVGASSMSASSSMLDAKRKSGTRLRSPVPSPPSISPSSSPSRSRFKVFRVHEVTTSILSPMSLATTTTPTTSASVAIPITPCTSYTKKVQSASLPSPNTMSLMATVTSSTESIKRYSVSPRSRFHVSKIYEDPKVPLSNRALPPITPPFNAPPTPMLKSSAATKLSSSPQVPQASLVNPEAVPAVAAAPTATTILQKPPIITNAPVAAIIIVEPSHEAKVDSTKTTTTTLNPNINTTTNTNTAAVVTNSAPTTATLSPILSGSSSSTSSSSSSSSTSPASNSSSSSILSASSSASSSSTPLFDSSSSSSGVSDMADSATDLSAGASAATATAVSRCPIAVFDENDITLTNNPINNMLSNAATTKLTTESVDVASSELSQQSLPAQPARARKTSWLGNPAAVDKLLTLFHNPGTIFQRSSSPDVSSNVSGSALPSALPAEVTTQPIAPQKSLMPTRKCSPPTWSKLGNEMMRPVTSALQQTNAGETSTTASLALATTAEQSLSFLDAASKQISDFSKQVFRQNLAFGNETTNTLPLVAAGGSLAGAVLSNVTSGGGGALSGSGLLEQHDAAGIPSEVQLEIKENISPEHTITDDTLQSLQKLCGVVTTNEGSGGGGGGVSGGGLGASMSVSTLDMPSIRNECSSAGDEAREQLAMNSSSSGSTGGTTNAGGSNNVSNRQHEETQAATPQTS